MSGVVIAGVGIHPFGRFDGISYQALGRKAAADAFADASVRWADVGAAFCGSMYLPPSSGARILSTFGLTGITIVDVEAACASGAVALSLAVQAVQSGRVDIALALGVEKRPRGFLDPRGIFDDWQIAMGLSQAPIYWALWARRYMEDYGITAEQIAQVSVKNHRHGVDNPNAMYRRAVTTEEVLASRLVCDPIHLLELCAPNEGAAAVVVMSADRARRHRLDAVKVSAMSLRTSGYPQRRAPAFSFSAGAGTPPETTVAARAAYAESGIGPDDLDLVELQDADAFQELLYSEQLGLAEAGEATKLLEDGTSWLGGRRPVNVSGGLLSKGEPVGASALGQVVELALQLRGQAGQRQVPGAKAAMAHVVGAAGNCGVTILER